MVGRVVSVAVGEATGPGGVVLAVRVAGGLDGVGLALAGGVGIEVTVSVAKGVLVGTGGALHGPV